MTYLCPYARLLGTQRIKPFHEVDTGAHMWAVNEMFVLSITGKCFSVHTYSVYTVNIIFQKLECAESR